MATSSFCVAEVNVLNWCASVCMYISGSHRCVTSYISEISSICECGHICGHICNHICGYMLTTPPLKQEQLHFYPLALLRTLWVNQAIRKSNGRTGKWVINMINIILTASQSEGEGMILCRWFQVLAWSSVSCMVATKHGFSQVLLLDALHSSSRFRTFHSFYLHLEPVRTC